MKKNVKILLSVLLAVVVIAAGSFAGIKLYKSGEDARIERKVEKIKSTVYPVTVDFDSLEREEFSSVYAFDVFDLNKLVTYVDYVFVARVDKIEGTTYRNVFYKSDGTVAAVPETHYTVTVLKVIKGDLTVGATVPLIKHGGVNYDNAALTIASGDSMPKAGEYYVFSGYDEEDGIYVSDPVGNTQLSAATVENQSALEAAIREYVEAEKQPDAEIAALKEKTKANKQAQKLSE